MERRVLRTSSTDGGRTITENIRISDRSIDRNIDAYQSMHEPELFVRALRAMLRQAAA